MNSKQTRIKLLAGLLFLAGASVLFDGVTRYFNDDFTASLFAIQSQPVNIGAMLIMITGAAMITIAAFTLQRSKHAETRIT